MSNNILTPGKNFITGDSQKSVAVLPMTPEQLEKLQQNKPQFTVEQLKKK